MRLALALVTLACAGSAAAEPVQDRYGPPRKASAVPARAYEGRLLGWAGKAAPRPAAPAPAELAAIPEPQSLAREFRGAVPPAPAAPPARPETVQAAALPQSLYDAPAGPPAPRVTQVAAAPPPPTPQPGAASSRLYSLHREYGMAPDTVPATPSGPNYVLIGPSDAPAEADEDEAPVRKPSVDARLF